MVDAVNFHYLERIFYLKKIKFPIQLWSWIINQSLPTIFLKLSKFNVFAHQGSSTIVTKFTWQIDLKVSKCLDLQHYKNKNNNIVISCLRIMSLSHDKEIYVLCLFACQNVSICELNTPSHIAYRLIYALSNLTRWISWFFFRDNKRHEEMAIKSKHNFLPDK